MKMLKVALSALALMLAPLAFAAPAAKMATKPATTTMVKTHQRVVAKTHKRVVAKRAHKLAASRTHKRILAKRTMTKTTIMKAVKK